MCTYKRKNAFNVKAKDLFQFYSIFCIFSIYKQINNESHVSVALFDELFVANHVVVLVGSN